jgi:hypothetical protein
MLRGEVGGCESQVGGPENGEALIDGKGGNVDN